MLRKMVKFVIIQKNYILHIKCVRDFRGLHHNEKEYFRKSINAGYFTGNCSIDICFFRIIQYADYAEPEQKTQSDDN